jgi:long-chain fatty acid transport protein
MAGASTAAPLDSIGALYWNPATISALPQSELGFGVDAIFANHTIGSSVGAVSGSTRGESGAVPVPNVGWVHHLDGTPFTLGLGVNGLAGFKTNVPADASNPVIAPPPAGLGSISAQAAWLQISPVVSVLVTDKLAIGGGPTITTALVGLEPFILDSANTNGRYASGQASRYHWGGGAQIGFFYSHNCCWAFGGSVKTPSWMETFRFFGQDANNNHRVLHAKFDLPLIISLGSSFSPTKDLLFALDLRYLDYENADGFGDRASFDNTGKLNGLDWSSVFAMSLGAQKRMSDKFTVRGGYGYNQLPIKNSESIFNSGSPLLYQHRFTGGASYYLSPSTAISAAYEFYPEVSRTGPMVLPTGVVPGATVTNSVSVHTVSLGITVRH